MATAGTHHSAELEIPYRSNAVVSIDIPVPPTGTAGILGTVIVSKVVVTACPNAKTRPVIVTVVPIVTSACPANIVPVKLLLAPSVVAPVGTQYTPLDSAPPDKWMNVAATVSSQPVILKI